MAQKQLEIQGHAAAKEKMTKQVSYNSNNRIVRGIKGNNTETEEARIARWLGS